MRPSISNKGRGRPATITQAIGRPYTACRVGPARPRPEIVATLEGITTWKNRPRPAIVEEASPEVRLRRSTTPRVASPLPKTDSPLPGPCETAPPQTAVKGAIERPSFRFCRLQFDPPLARNKDAVISAPHAFRPLRQPRTT